MDLDCFMKFSSPSTLPHTPRPSQLPGEIWRHIFDFATREPSILATKLPNIGGLPMIPTLSDSQESVEAALVTRRTLVRVCTQWRSLATEFLYEAVLLTRGEHLTSLSRTLDQSGKKGSVCSRYGWWTKRLDLAIKDHRMFTGDGVGQWNALALALRCFPNLSIFTFDVDIKNPGYDDLMMPDSVLSALIEVCAPSLRVIQSTRMTRGVAFTPSANDLISLLCVAPNLRLLHCTQLARSPTARSLPYPLLQNITSLEYDSSMSDCFRNENCLPNLRHVAFTQLINGVEFRIFLRAHGEKIRSIELSDRGGWFQIDMHDIVEYCPNLTALDLMAPWWVSMESTPDWPPFPTEITILALRSRPKEFERGNRMNEEVFFRGFNELLGLEGALHLQAIRFLDPHFLSDVRQCANFGVLRRSLEAFGSQGIGWEDHEGRPITLRRLATG